MKWPWFLGRRRSERSEGAAPGAEQGSGTPASYAVPSPGSREESCGDFGPVVVVSHDELLSGQVANPEPKHRFSLDTTRG